METNPLKEAAPLLKKFRGIRIIGLLTVLIGSESLMHPFSHKFDLKFVNGENADRKENWNLCDPNAGRALAVGLRGNGYSINSTNEFMRTRFLSAYLPMDGGASAKHVLDGMTRVIKKVRSHCGLPAERLIRTGEKP